MMFDRAELNRVAYAMERAYKTTNDLMDATHEVSEQFPELETKHGILSAMWLAIDAYVALNT